jgi:flagellar biosynthesis/type III secretory pathway protein FliH
MSARFRLEVFELPDESGESVTLSQGAIEDTRLAAFEQGYAAGWEDAVAAQDQSTARLRADFARNLEDLSFTYAEAHRHVLRALEPLLRDMVGKVLPAMARDTLGSIVIEQLLPIARDLAGVPIEVVVCPASRPLVESLIAASVIVPLTVSEEPTLSEGQVYLRFADRERCIDLDGVIAAIGDAVADFFQIEQEKVRRHG